MKISTITLPYDFSKEELLAESELWIGHDSIFKIFKHALKSKVVIITSDMYLLEKFIIKILAREKYVECKRLYLSPSVVKTKKQGHYLMTS